MFVHLLSYRRTRPKTKAISKQTVSESHALNNQDKNPVNTLHGTWDVDLALWLVHLLFPEASLQMLSMAVKKSFLRKANMEQRQRYAKLHKLNWTEKKC